LTINVILDKEHQHAHLGSRRRWRALCLTLSLALSLALGLAPQLGCQQPSPKVEGICLATKRPEGLILAGTGGGIALMRALTSQWRQRDDQAPPIMIPPSIGTSGGFKALQDGAIDAALSARALKADELAHGLQAHLIGHSPLVFVVPAQLPIDAITTQNLERYYTHELTQWPSGAPATPLYRERTDSGLALIKDYAPELGRRLSQLGPDKPVLYTNQAMRDALLESEGALGWLDLNTLKDNAPDRLKALRLDGRDPYTDRSYPLMQPLYLITRGELSDKLGLFLDFLKTPLAKRLLQEHGYFPAPDQRD